MMRIPLNPLRALVKSRLRSGTGDNGHTLINHGAAKDTRNRAGLFSLCMNSRLPRVREPDCTRAASWTGSGPDCCRTVNETETYNFPGPFYCLFL